MRGAASFERQSQIRRLPVFNQPLDTPATKPAGLLRFLKPKLYVGCPRLSAL